MSAVVAITVLQTAAEIDRNQNADGKGIPRHWDDARHSGFHNPWPSFRKAGFTDMLSLLPTMLKFAPKIPATIDTLLPVRTPTWGRPNPGENNHASTERIKATWLGHACFLLELPIRDNAPSPAPSRGPRILFDPVFSDRCSPSQHVGPKRFTKPPCKMDEIPEVDVVVISHNHYDHLDTTTILNLASRPRPPHIFAPLGNEAYFRSIGIPDAHVHTLDWWESRRVEVNIPIAQSPEHSDAPESTTPSSTTMTTMRFDVTCTPAQHFTGRGVLDRFKSLWASWVVAEVPDTSIFTATTPTKVFFGGDTGYRSVRDGEDEAQVPVCPVFKEIGERFGGFDLAMIPIGAYLPRDFMSSIHCAPQDSVRIFQDIRAKRAVGMHWGAWVLTTEDVLEPPRRLAEECAKAGIEEGAFRVCDIGETLFF